MLLLYTRFQNKKTQKPYSSGRYIPEYGLFKEYPTLRGWHIGITISDNTSET